MSVGLAFLLSNLFLFGLIISLPYIFEFIHIIFNIDKARDTFIENRKLVKKRIKLIKQLQQENKK